MVQNTLDIAILGNWAPDLPGRPRIGMYVRTTPRDDRIFTREFRGRMGHHQLLNGQAADRSGCAALCPFSLHRLTGRFDGATPVGVALAVR